jgi:hypothetical protein
MPKDKFVEIDGELGAAHAVMGSDKPLLEVADRTIRQGHDGFGSLTKVTTQRLNTRHVLKSGLLQSCEAF